MVLLLSLPLHWRTLLLNSNLCNLNILLVATYQFVQRESEYLTQKDGFWNFFL